MSEHEFWCGASVHADIVRKTYSRALSDSSLVPKWHVGAAFMYGMAWALAIFSAVKVFS